MAPRILLTGGAGFIGGHMVRLLLDDDEVGEGPEVLVTLDKLTYAGHREQLPDDARHHFVQGDIADRPLVEALLREHRIDTVLHLAAESHVDRSIAGSGEFVATNLVGTHQLLEAVRTVWDECGPGRPRFIHVSTDEVFGELAADAAPFDEHSRYAPGSPYSATKAASDHLVRAWHRTYGLPTIVTASGNNYGPWQFPEKLIPRMIQRLLRGGSVPLYGDGSQRRDWLHVEDHCRALWRVCLVGQVGASYLIGARCERSNLEVAGAVIDALAEIAPDRLDTMGRELIESVPDRPGHDRRYALDPSRAETELGWSPRHDFEEGLRDTVSWCLDHEEWLERMAMR